MVNISENSNVLNLFNEFTLEFKVFHIDILVP